MRVFCRVSKGPMAHEVSVIIRGVDRDYESWADTKDVEVVEGQVERGARGLLPVRVLRTEAEQGRTLVELPAEVIMGTRRVWVPTTELER